MTKLRIVLLIVIGLVIGYGIGIQRVTAQQCPQPLTCTIGLSCQAYDYFCSFECNMFNKCLWWVGRCSWDPDGPVCSTVTCVPDYYCN